MHHIQEYFSHIGKFSFQWVWAIKLTSKPLMGPMTFKRREESLLTLPANMIQDLSLHSLIWRTTNLALLWSQGIKMRTCSHSNPHRMMQKRVFTIFYHLPNIPAAYEGFKGEWGICTKLLFLQFKQKSFQHSGGFNPCIDRDICAE